MAHPVVFRYLAYPTMLAEHAVHRLRRLGLLEWDMYVQFKGYLPTEWPHDHGPTNVRAMVKCSGKVAET